MSDNDLLEGMARDRQAKLKVQRAAIRNQARKIADLPPLLTCHCGWQGERQDLKLVCPNGSDERVRCCPECSAPEENLNG